MTGDQRLPYWQFRFRNLQSGYSVTVGTFAATLDEARTACANSLREGWAHDYDMNPIGTERAWNPA